MGSAAADVIYGYAGSDRIRPRGGDDSVYGGAGGDDIAGCGFGYGPDRSGRDVIYAGSGNDYVWVCRGDRAHLGPGHDKGYGAGVGALIHGGAGSDVLYADYDPGRLYGDHGNDTVCGPWTGKSGAHHQGAYRYFLGYGNDKAFWGASCSEEPDSMERDLVFGGPGDDRIRMANGGPDRVFAGSGDDTVVVAWNRGIKLVDCGPGRDSLTFKVGAHPMVRRCEHVRR